MLRYAPESGEANRDRAPDSDGVEEWDEEGRQDPRQHVHDRADLHEVGDLSYLPEPETIRIVGKPIGVERLVLAAKETASMNGRGSTPIWTAI